ncbi:MAG: hypothetical protein ABH840_03125 [Nanoarchaeota archaeon]
MKSRKQGQLKKISVGVVLILLLTILFVAAQNILETPETQEQSTSSIETQATEIPENTGLQNDEPETTNTDADAETGVNDNIIETIQDLCENVNCDISTLICPDGFVDTCENSCISETGACTSCTPSCEGNEQATDNEIKNETETIKNETETNKTGDITEDETNQTYTNETQQETILPEQNETITPGTGGIITDLPLIQQDLDIQISHPAKITRGEIIEIKAKITNSGNEVKNAGVDWTLPEGFEIIYRNQKSCENLNTGESCELIIRIQTSLSTSLGKGEVKAIVSYKT